MQDIVYKLVPHIQDSKFTVIFFIIYPIKGQFIQILSQLTVCFKFVSVYVCKSYYLSQHYTR